MAMRIPPQSIEAEESVLGAMMLDKESIIKVFDFIQLGDFYKPIHNKIFEVILRLTEKGDPVDALSVTNSLRERGWLEEVGGTVFITDLLERVPTTAHVEHYAKIVKDKKVLRELITLGAETQEIAFQPKDEVESVLDNVEQKIFAISQRSITHRFTAIQEELKGAYERIERLHSGEGRLRGVATGFQGIDNLLSGLQPSDLVILGARPSVGKTTFALDVARNAALIDKRPVGIFSLEMSKDQVIDRIVSSVAGVPLWQLRTGQLRSEMDFQLIQMALDKLHDAPIYIDDTPSPTILQMRSMARRLQIEHGLALLVVDYLQLIKPRTDSDNVVAQITEVSRGLKGIARELNVPILALAQLSRAVEQREVRIPKLSDLRDSGSIEQDADVVMFIYRPDRDKINPDPSEENTTQIIIAKHRNGPLGNVDLKFNKDQVSFRDIDRVHSAPPHASTQGF